MNQNNKHNVVLTIASVLILAGISWLSLHTIKEPSEETVEEIVRVSGQSVGPATGGKGHPKRQ